MAKILVVDDNQSAADALCEMVARGTGHDVTVVYSPEKALEKVRESNFDLVISDYSMPTINGVQLAKQIQLLANPRIPVIIFTGDSENMIKSQNAPWEAGLIAAFLEKHARGELIRQITAKVLAMPRVANNVIGQQEGRIVE